MEIQVKFVSLGNFTEGTSARGAWRKQELIVETTEQYPKKICMICWGDKIDDVQKLMPNQLIKAQISIESREFNGKWYTDVRIINFIAETQQQYQPEPPFQAQTQTVTQTNSNPNPPFGEIPVTDYFETDNGDDLPF